MQNIRILQILHFICEAHQWRCNDEISSSGLSEAETSLNHRQNRFSWFEGIAVDLWSNGSHWWGIPTCILYSDFVELVYLPSWWKWTLVFHGIVHENLPLYFKVYVMTVLKTDCMCKTYRFGLSLSAKTWSLGLVTPLQYSVRDTLPLLYDPAYAFLHYRQLNLYKQKHSIWSYANLTNG